MKKLVAITSLFLLILAFPAFSQKSADPLLKKVLEELHIEDYELDKSFSRTKELPNDKNTVLYLLSIPEEKEQNTNYDVYIVLVDKAQGKILAQLYEKERWSSDAMHLESVELDMAAYILSNNCRAFGVRTSFYNNSRPNPFNGKYLSLYIRKENTIVKVLDDLETYLLTGELTMDCEGHLTIHEKTLIMSLQQTEGFNDINIKTKVTERELIKEGEDCKDEDSISNLQSKLVYDKLRGRYFPKE